ncbi:MAG TPA: hypothetical protein VE359_00980 [Vicinamibacteria bacterium]|nr:hypothetical protein [Vicinamibacteria bacterium]
MHFRPAGGPHWYSVPMKAEGGVFAGVLPKPKKSLQKLDYYIEATDTSFGSARSAQPVQLPARRVELERWSDGDGAQLPERRLLLPRGTVSGHDGTGWTAAATCTGWGSWPSSSSRALVWSDPDARKP